MLRAILAEDLARVEKLVAIDFHTGLGEAGAGEMIIEALPGSAAYDARASDVGRRWWRPARRANRSRRP